MLQITLVKSNISNHALEQLLAWLAPVELQQFKRLTRLANQQHYAIARVLSRTLLTQQLRQQTSALSAAQLVFSYNHYGKPTLANAIAPNLHFNLSHSADYVVIAIAKQPVGIDIEMRPNHAVSELVQHLFSPSERQQLQQVAQQPSADYSLEFLKLWCAKEALLKAQGYGLQADIKQLELSLPQLNRTAWLTPSKPPFNQYSVRLLDSPANYQLAVSIAAQQPEQILQTNIDSAAELLELAQQYY